MLIISLYPGNMHFLVFLAAVQLWCFKNLWHPLSSVYVSWLWWYLYIQVWQCWCVLLCGGCIWSHCLCLSCLLCCANCSSCFPIWVSDLEFSRMSVLVISFLSFIYWECCVVMLCIVSISQSLVHCNCGFGGSYTARRHLLCGCNHHLCWTSTHLWSYYKTPCQLWCVKVSAVG